MAQIPPGIIKSQLSQGTRDLVIFILTLTAIWSLIYLVPLEAIFEQERAPIFLIKVFERMTGVSDRGFPWVSLIFTVIVFGIVTICALHVKDLLKLDPELVLSDTRKQTIPAPAGSIAEFERDIADGKGGDWNSVWVTPNWVFVGTPANQLLRTDDIAWVYFRGSKVDKAVNAGSSLALSASGVVNASQSRAIRENQSEGSVLVFHLKSDPVPVEIDASPYAAEPLRDLLLKYNPNLIFGWQKSFEAAWRSDRDGFEAYARKRIDALTEQGKDGLPFTTES